MRGALYKVIAISTLMSSSICVSAQTESLENAPVKSNLKIFDTKILGVDARADQDESIKDPLQSFNRKVYGFNEVIDRNVLRPVAVLYSETLPPPAQGAHSNFTNNLKEPWNAVNQLLQGKPKQSLKTLGRFTLNTLTSLGFADPAKRLDLVQQSESFGTTLGVWGVPSGPYIMLPFLGSSSLRDGAGRFPDGFARLQSYMIEPDRLNWTNTAFEITAMRAQYLSVDSIIQGDKYAAMRDVYLQQRAFEIAQKRGEDISQSMFIDDPFDDEVIDPDLDEELIEDSIEPQTAE